MHQAAPERRSYQDKRVRRGTPSARYREMHAFPTTKQEFGNAEFYSMDGRWQMRVADGPVRTKMVRRGAIQYSDWGGNPAIAPTTYGGTQLMFYRLPRQRKGSGPKRVPQAGQRVSMVHATTGMLFTGEVTQRSGSFYRITNAGTIVLRDVTPLGRRVRRDEVEAMESNATAAMMRKMRRAIKE
jgi:hypothetical protein